jgi:hypothetical protein
MTNLNSQLEGLLTGLAVNAPWKVEADSSVMILVR